MAGLKDTVIIGMDPSIQNWGMVAIDGRDGMKMIDALVVVTKPDRRKAMTDPADIMRRSATLREESRRFVAKTGGGRIASEIPAGSRNFDGAKANGIVLATLSIFECVLCVTPQQVKRTIQRTVPKSMMDRARAQCVTEDKTKVGSMLFAQVLNYDLSCIKTLGIRHHAADAIAVVATVYDMENGPGAFEKARLG